MSENGWNQDVCSSDGGSMRAAARIDDGATKLRGNPLSCLDDLNSYQKRTDLIK